MYLNKISELTDEEIQIIIFLEKYTSGKWTFNKKTGLVDIEGNFYCDNKKLKDFKGVKFGVVTGNFGCHNNSLTSLEGAPQEVGGCFYCYDNSLTSLEGAPKEVKGYFYCSHNKLTSLEGAPQEVGVGFNCSDNKLTSLEGAPKEVGGGFDCSDNKLTSLEGAPQVVEGIFWCDGNPISKETLSLVFKTMHEKKLDYWIALSLLKSEILTRDFKKLEGELEKRISKDAQKGISMLDRFKVFD